MKTTCAANRRGARVTAMLNEVKENFLFEDKNNLYDWSMSPPIGDFHEIGIRKRVEEMFRKQF